jgi:predicted AlkP superfamily phosphohydrolase/phosphomutase
VSPRAPSVPRSDRSAGSRRSAAALLPALFLGLLLCVGTWTCARAGEKPRPKVLLIGIDAGEWDVLGPLLDEGKAPSFARMRNGGASGTLRSLEPLTKSPIIWASIATGKVPSKHGIADFLSRRRAEDRARARGEIINPADTGAAAPVTSNLWRARPMWDILGSLGKRVDVVGWWTTWPATPVNGSLISDYVQYDEGAWPARGSHRTYPDSLESLVTRMRRTPASVSWAEVFQFVPPIDTTNVTPRQQQLVQELKYCYAADMTFFQIARELYRRDQPEFFTVYFRGVDEMSHRYWDIDVPGIFNPSLTDAEYQWLKKIIPNYYVFTDRLVGELLKLADKNTNVIVCSDHGFIGGGHGVMAHKVDGIVFLMGPGIQKGANIAGATVLDIAPTTLALFGLPTAQDMDGRPIEDGLKPSVMARLKQAKRLGTYETASRRKEGEEPLRSPIDEELRERLRSLGYIQ